MPAAQKILSNNFVQQSIKQDLLRSPRSKIGKHRGNRRFQTSCHPKLCVLSKPENNVVNGKNRHRFPDPSHDKCVLLGIFDKGETLVKLHYIDKTGINIDESLEKDILHSPHGVHYFLKLEQVQIDLPNGKAEIETNLHSKHIICAKLSDHTVSDSSVPKEVAGYWIRMFGPESVFTMNFTLWSAEVNRSYSSQFPLKGKGTKEDFYNLEKLDDIHVQFGNKLRNKKNPIKNTKKKVPSKKQNVFEVLEIVKLIKRIRYLRDNGKIEEFEAQCSQFRKHAKKNENLDEELVIILEESVCLCYRGNPAEGKRLLQKAVQLSSKSKNSEAIKNRAYLCLALIHIHDGSYGTAQECLGMVDKEMGVTLSAEDMAFKLMLHGIAMMNFGKKLSEMSKNLWQESSENFENALELCIANESGTVTEDTICIIHLWLATLNLAMLKSACSPGCQNPELENKVIEQLNFFEDIEPVKLSRRTTIYGLLLQGEFYIFLKRKEEATAVFENIRELIAIDKRIYCLEARMLEKIQKAAVTEVEDENDNVIAMIAKTRDLLVKSESDTGYSADESSSNEVIDLEAARYKQTTYV